MHIPRGGREREESREGGREKERGGGGGGGERERERDERDCGEGRHLFTCSCPLCGERQTVIHMLLLPV